MKDSTVERTLNMTADAFAGTVHGLDCQIRKSTTGIGERLVLQDVRKQILARANSKQRQSYAKSCGGYAKVPK